MPRAFILLFDSFGIGETPDAADFGDQGANTYGHIAKACALNQADNEARKGPLQLPNLNRLGLSAAANQLAGKTLPGTDSEIEPAAAYGFAREVSRGKDTPSGHWEIAGVPVLFDWGYFPKTPNCFPDKLIEDFLEQAKLPGTLGNCHASGTDIINELGDEHIQTGKPIIYTSGDSVFQIACHEAHFGLERLYEICLIAKKLIEPLNIGRVIARPFVGSNGQYTRTGNRRDYTAPPPAPTLLNHLVDAGHAVYAIGKIADIYAHSGISKTIKADGNLALFDALLKTTKRASDNSLSFVNFVDFDSKYGHRRDVAGYAAALEALDKRLPEFEALMQPGDLAVIAADHGCDPTMPGSDHTREYIPCLFFGPGIKPGFMGERSSFADIGQTLATHLGLTPLDTGEAILLSLDSEKTKV
jgi:phosphopentomutase